MVLIALLVLSAPSNVVAMESVDVVSDRGPDCKLPIDYRFGRITSHYGMRDNPFGPGKKFHYGIDIESDEGVSIRSITEGYVYYARQSSAGGGLQVMVRSPSGLKFKYSHMSKILVKKGQTVKAGTLLGEVGSTGKALGSHLHLEVYRNKGNLKDDHLDPVQFVCKYRTNLWKGHTH
jgi:murein DD-endopeptidase MepM/ murein hydrolase activator NlpD